MSGKAQEDGWLEGAFVHHVGEALNSIDAMRTQASQAEFDAAQKRARAHIRAVKACNYLADLARASGEA